MPFRTAHVALLALAALAAGACWTPARAAGGRAGTPDSGVREQVRVRLVTLDVRALDRGGDPVADLDSGEIRVEYEGRELDVAFLDPLRPAPREPRADLRLRAVSNPPTRLRPVESAAGGRSVFVLLDLLNTMERDLPSLRGHVARFVAKAAPADLVGLGTAEADVRVRVPPTRDRAALLGVLADETNFERPEDDPLPGVFRDIQMDRIFRPVTRGAGSYLFDDRRCEGLAIATLEALRGAIDLLSPLSGRKELVFVSEGFSMACQDASFQDEVRFDLATPFRDDEENDPRYRYPVKKGKIRYRADKEVPHSGIRGALDRVLDAAARARVSIVTVHPVSGGGRAAFQDPSLNALARHTGGVHLAGGGITSALERAAESREGLYELGYYLPEDLSARAPREVEVSTTRRRVRLFASRGRSEDPPLRQWEDNALRLGQPSLVGRRAGRVSWSVPVVVDPAAFRFVPAGESLERTRFALSLALRDAQGRELGETAVLAWLERARGHEAPPPSRFVLDVSAPRGAHVLRARLNEPDGGAIARRETELRAAQSVEPDRDASAEGAEAGAGGL